MGWSEDLLVHPWVETLADWLDPMSADWSATMSGHWSEDWLVH